MNKNGQERDGCAVALGAVLSIVSIVLFICSFNWSWTSHSTRKAFVTYDFHWLQYIFYPGVILLLIIGLVFLFGVSKK